MPSCGWWTIAAAAPGTIEVREGTLGGRIARNLKIATGAENREVKQAEYGGAKKAVLDAMIAHYGEAIGTMAFRSALGRTHADGSFETSHDHPITGRHIETMLQVAQDEVGGHEQMAGWMDDVLGRTGQPGTRRVDLGEKISQPTEGRIAWHEVAIRLPNDLADDRRMLFEAEPQGTPADDHKFWMVDVTLIDGSRRAFGLHVSRDDRDNVEVKGIGGATEKMPIMMFGRFVEEQCATLGAVRSVSLHRAADEVLGGDGGRTVALDPFPDVRFTPHGDGLQADLKQVLSNDVLNGIYDGYAGQFDERELDQTQHQRYASIPLHERADERRDDLTIESGRGNGRVALWGGDAWSSAINDRIMVMIPPGRDEPGEAREATQKERKLLTRFLHDGVFQQLHAATMERMYPGLRLGAEPPVHLTVLARRDDNDDVVFDITFEADLPQTDDGREAALKMTLSVPLSELDSARPAFELGEQTVVLGPGVEIESLDDDDQDEVQADAPPFPPREPGIEVGDRIGDMEAIVAGGQASLKRDTESFAAGERIGNDLRMRLADPGVSTRISIDSGPPEKMADDPELPQLRSFKGSDGMNWRLDDAQRHGLTRFLGGGIFDQVYNRIVGNEDGARVRDLTVAIRTEVQKKDLMFALTFEAPLPESVDDGGLRREGDQLALQMTVYVSFNELDTPEPPFACSEPELVRT